jgi:general secretion pathway protein D
MGLYSNNPMYAMSLMASFSQMGMGSMNNGAYGGNVFGSGMGGMGMGGMGMGGMGMGGMGMGGMGMGGMGMGMGGMYGGMYGGGMYGGGMYGGAYQGPAASIPSATGMAASAAGGTAGTSNLTGQYLGAGATGGQGYDPRAPRIIPNPFDNTLLIQATRTEYEGILKLLRDIDVPPRQVLIEAKIYEVVLNGELKSGVAAYLQEKGAAPPEGYTNKLAGVISGGGITITGGTVVGQTRQLLAALTASELTSNARVISAPSLIATDSVAASINVGTQVPTLTSQAVTGIQAGGSSVFANNVTNRDTGVTLNILARVNPSGIVTLIINQEVSAPIAPSTDAAIQSPSFSKRTVSTQVTVQDGDTVGIAGIINERSGNSSSGVPFMHRVPIIGAAFGSKAFSKDRTELIIFMTPRVIYDMANIAEATDELKSRLRKLNKYVKEEDR